MSNRIKKLVRKLGWFGRLAEEHAKSPNLEPGVSAIGMAVEDFQKNRTRAAVMERDMPVVEPASERQKEGKPSWEATKLCCPKCGSDRVLVTASGKKCMAVTCGVVFDLRTENQLR